MGSKKKSSKQASRQAQQDRSDELARQMAIRSGTSRIDDVFGQFNDDFYNNRQKAFLDYSTPQLESQYGDAQKQLTYSLDRAGTLDSSIRANKFGELQKLYDTNKQQLADQALSYQTDARNNIENARSGLVSTLNTTGDAEGAVNQALARSTALSAPQAFSPLSQLFASFTSGLGTQAAQEKAEALSNGAYKAKYNTGLFGNSPTSVKTY